MNKGAFRHNEDGSFSAVVEIGEEGDKEICVAMLHADEGGYKFYMDYEEAAWLANQIYALVFNGRNADENDARSEG